MKLKRFIPNLFLLSVICCLLFLIRPALLGQLGGTFHPQDIPQEYIVLKDFLVGQNSYFRTFWMPTPSRYSLASYSHPRISASDYLGTVDYKKLLKKMDDRTTPLLLQESGVKYVIVPYDSRGEIFLKDRKYDERQYQSMIRKLQKVTWLHEVDGFGRIKVFELKDYKDHFYLPDCELRIANCGLDYKFINPTKYSVSVGNARKGDVLVFSEGFDKNWIIHCELRMTNCGFGKIKSQKLVISNQQSVNSFILPEDGSYDLEIYYAPQKWVDIGMGISAATLILIILLIAYYELRIKKI